MAGNRELKQARMAFDAICSAFDSVGWRYEKDEDELSVTSGAVGDDLPMPIQIKVNVEKELVMLLSQLPFTVPEDRRREMAVAVAKANNGLANGSFDYDLPEGDIVFRITASIRNSLISEKAFGYLVGCACNTVDEYNDKFLLVAKSEMTCDEVAAFID